MFKRLLALAAVTIGSILLFGKKTENNQKTLEEPSSIDGIPQSRVYKSHMIVHAPKMSKDYLDQEITEKLLQIIENYSEFIIGKTSDLKTRPKNYQKGYKEMYVLCESTDSYFIDALEIRHIDMHKGIHPKNKNKKRGGGELNRDKTEFYMYIAVK